MLSHVFRLIWNRRRANALLIAQIVGAFLVLFGAATVLVRMIINYRQPMGMTTARVWRLNLHAGGGDLMPRPLLDAVLGQVRALPGVADLTLTSANTPFHIETHSGYVYRGATESPEIQRYDADDTYAATLGLRVREGRWFRPTDDARPHRPVVLSRALRDALFQPGEAAVGALLHDARTADLIDLETRPSDLHRILLPQSDGSYEVVGVADDIRVRSDFKPADPAIWMRLQPFDTSRWDGAAVLLRVTPDADPALARQIVRTIARCSPGWRAKLRWLDADRRAVRRDGLRPALVLGGISALLTLNVALVLFGVLWHAIQQRRAEIGLRRAVGAPAGLIRAQLVGETLVVTSFGVVLGVGLAVQLPLLNAFDTPPLIYNIAIGLTSGFLLTLAAVCALYPSWLAARTQPARALRE